MVPPLEAPTEPARHVVRISHGAGTLKAIVMRERKELRLSETRREERRQSLDHVIPYLWRQQGTVNLKPSLLRKSCPSSQSLEPLATSVRRHFGRFRRCMKAIHRSPFVQVRVLLQPATNSRNAIQVLNSPWTLEGIANPSHRGGQIPCLVLVLHVFACRRTVCGYDFGTLFRNPSRFRKPLSGSLRCSLATAPQAVFSKETMQYCILY